MSDAMDAEFDVLAEWTADAALELGPDHHLPAACRGSGGPRTLDLLLDELAPSAGQTLLDVGAGVGGPGAYAARRHGVAPLLSDPEAGAGRAARRLFDLPAVQADAQALPVADAAVPLAWALGVLCTTDDHTAVLRELRRVVAAGGRAGLLVYVAQCDVVDPPAGNNFPTEGGLAAAVRDAGFIVRWTTPMPPPSQEPPAWQEHADAVERVVQERHGDSDAWRTADRQSTRFGELLASGDVRGRLLVLE
ncbi:Methyltransferase domain-containing protein [Jatrophihabitans endophyticus]|uniref:Methyltransferase domain-containing protein n=1 Tax=Jatrophihabitans endophyticus TaxID=1206085 RepID=A0A1M5E4S8_9ACTN|nr:methyltransferase domain-containing protein [Jatrophihabitans endophyticus]SHF74082.1 Methyltransferase domain-containing protein [Jatrophihabitans endophyticus]